MIVLRAENVFPDGADGAEIWRAAADLAARLPVEFQGVFLLLCRAAVTGDCCPDDAMIASFFGSHSPGRARRILTQLEQLEMIVVRTDLQQRRIVAIPELGIETAAEGRAAPEDCAAE